MSWVSCPWKVPLKHPGAKPAQDVCAAAGLASAAVRIAAAAIDTWIWDVLVRFKTSLLVFRPYRQDLPEEGSAHSSPTGNDSSVAYRALQAESTRASNRWPCITPYFEVECRLIA